VGFDYKLPEPRTKDEIVTALRDLHRASRSFWDSFTSEIFLAAPQHGWSPAGNVRHLNKAMQPLTRALHMPRLVLWTMFGKAGEPSRSLTGLRDTYLATLAQGGSAGSFAPEEAASLGKDDSDRAKLLNTHDETVGSLVGAIEGWADDDLDRYLLPHPLLGKLTVREMLFFTVYHNYHHVRNVAARQADARQASSASASAVP
jgi:hypothetical protein